MRVKIPAPRKYMAVMICAVLLAAFACVAPYTRGETTMSTGPSARNHVADGAPANQDQGQKSGQSQHFRAHQVEIAPVMFRYTDEQAHRVWHAGASVKPVQFACQREENPQPSLCYGPYQIRRAYHVTELLNQQLTGKGTTITIIDAYGNPNIRKDLHAFDTVWGLPDPQLNIIAPYGTGTPDDAWISETSLDVEWAHAMAPGATINLVLAKDSNDVSIYQALAYAVKHNLGDIISLSFGENELCVDAKLRQAEQRVLREAVAKGMTIVAATGDFGSAQPTCGGSSFEKAVSFPASDPLVTAVGGTTLMANPVTGRYIRETAWNESRTFNKATGGGYSKIYPVPAFQRGLVGNAPGRALPDLALNASVDGGVIVLATHQNGTPPAIDIMGGTSAAAPELAGILAIGMQIAHHRLGTINPALYKLGAGRGYPQLMHDIRTGNNILLSTNLKGYAATPGWDATTGWGSPRAAGPFLRALIANRPSTPPIIPTPIPGPGTPTPPAPLPTPLPPTGTSLPTPGSTPAPVPTGSPPVIR